MRPCRRRALGDRVAAAAALALACLLLLRVARYQLTELPEALDTLLGDALIGAWLLFIFPLLAAPWHLAAAALLGLCLWLRPRAFLTRQDGVWRLRPWFHALLWLELALNHAFFDLNPRLALLTAFGFACIEIEHRVWGERAGDRRYAPIVALLSGVWIALSETWADATAGLILAALLVALLRPLKGRCGIRERRLLALAGGAASQLAAAALPLALPWHGGTRVGDGLAYSFCESAAARRLFVAVPEAPTMLPWSLHRPHGIHGYVAEYDVPALAEERRHRFFSEAFHGRLEWLVCLDDAVHIGMTNTTYRGRTEQDHAMAFQIADPTRFEADVMGGDVGHGIVYDERREALYFVSENQPAIARLDLRTGERRRVMTAVPQRKPALSLVVGHGSYQPERDSLFFAEWFIGTHAYEASLASEERVHLYPHRNGGALGLAVDATLGRLYVVGVWGMEVFDIESEKVLTRKRLGLLSRSPVIDPENDLIYVASTVEGKLRVFDRHSLELLGAIPIGHGPRLPYYSASMRRLFASSSRAYYFWDAEALARRFREAR